MFKRIKAKTPGEAWRKVAKFVMSNGEIVTDGKELLKEYLHLIVLVEKPLQNDKILKKFADKKMLEFMEKNFLETTPISEWGYSYGSRIFDFKGINQVEEIVKKLNEKPESKSALISLTDPTQDFKGHSPCVSVIDFKLRKDILITTAFLRSQDVGKKIYADIIAIGKISKLIADRLNVKSGPLILIIVSAHVYKRDFKKINKLIS
jgi:thymidylate synthase (methanogen type)